MTKFQHILVPIDFDPPSLHALDVAMDLAGAFDAEITLLHAWDIAPYEYAATLYFAADLWTAVEAAAKRQLDDVIARVRQRLPKAKAILARGPAALAVLEAVGTTKADLVVMGTHGRGGMAHLVLGSVAEKVVRGSSVPVLTVGQERAPAQAGQEKVSAHVAATSANAVEANA